MCIIVDTNVASKVFATPPCDAYRPIIDWISNGGGKLVYGGQLAKELTRMGKVAKLLVEWKRAGKAHQARDEEIERQENWASRSGLCCSDDLHTIGLARVTGARVLCTEDIKLITDFHNHRLVSKPRGKVYRFTKNKGNLCHSSGCLAPGPAERRRRIG